MPAEADPVRPSANRRLKPALALVIALAWLAVAAIVLVVGAQVGLAKSGVSLRDLLLTIGPVVVQVAAPLAVVLVSLVLLRRTGRDEVALITALEARQARALAANNGIRGGLDDVDRALTAIGARLELLLETANAEGRGLIDTATRLDAGATAMTIAGREAGAQANALMTLIPDASRQATAVKTILADTGAETTRQIGEIETLLAAVWARNTDAQVQAEAATAAITGVLTEIDAAATRTAAAVHERSTALHGSVDTALDRTTAALDATRDGVHAQTNALLASVDQARVALDHIGGEAARAIGKRLDRLNEAADQLGQRLSEQDARSRMLVETVERSFTVLDARLTEAAAASNQTLDGIAERMSVVRDQVQTMTAPFDVAHEAVREIETSASRLQEVARWVIGAFEDQLPAHGRSIATLADDVERLHGAAGQLGDPIAQGSDAITAAAAAFAQQRAEMEAASARLTGQLEAAKSLIGAIETQTDGTALAASNRLIEVLGRVREIAGTTSAQMRDTLQAVVADAEVALEHVGTTKAESAFGAPIREQLAAIVAASERAAEAAQGAVDRVAERLVGLTTTVAGVEARIDEVDTRFDVRLRDDLVTRSEKLLDALNRGSIDIARLLAVDLGDQTLDAYRKGDRSIFTRKVVKLVDAGTARAVKRHYEHDPAFREQATAYIDDFETLMRHVLADRDGKMLGVTMLSSDVGKLYVVLAEAIGRLA